MELLNWFKRLFQKKKPPIVDDHGPGPYLFKTRAEFPETGSEGQYYIDESMAMVYLFISGSYMQVVMAMPEVPNSDFKRLQGDVYIARNQKGFRDAVEEFKSMNPDFYFGGVDRPPSWYPSVVFLSKKYDGRPVIKAECVPVNRMRDILRDE